MTRIAIQRICRLLDPDEIAEVESILTNSLDRFAQKVRELQVSFVDVNGPKGGEDTVCKVRIGLIPRGSLIVSSTGNSVLAAARRASAKIHQSLERKLNKSRRISRIHEQALGQGL